MKKLTYIFLSLLMLVACTSRQEYGAMRQGLDSINERNRNDEPFTVSDVQPYLEFFERHGEPNDQMLANYMMGSAYRDEGNAPMALKYFRIATELADTTVENCDFHTLSRVYGQIATLFNMQRSPRLEIEAERKAVYFAWEAKDTISAITFYERLCLPYHMLNKMDSALYYSQGAAKLFKKIGRYDLAAGTLGLDIDVYQRRKDNEKLKQALDEYEQHSGFFDQRGNIEKGRETFYSYKGFYYEGVNKMDSAEYYYRITLQNNPNQNIKELAYRGLLSLYRKLRTSDSIAKYSELFCQANDSNSFAHSADEITRMQALYNYDESERRANLHERMTRNYKLTVISLFLVFAILSYLTIRVYRRQQWQKKQELMRANTEYSTLLTQFNIVQQDLKLSKQDQIRFREEKEKEIINLRKSLSLYQDCPQIITDWDIEQAMLNSPIVKELHNLASKAKMPSKPQWKTFREYMERELPDYVAKLNKVNILTYQEFLICLLMRLQFSQGEQSALFGVSKQRINNLKRSINRKLFGEDGAVSLSNNIINL